MRPLPLSGHDFLALPFLSVCTSCFQHTPFFLHLFSLSDGPSLRPVSVTEKGLYFFPTQLLPPCLFFFFFFLLPEELYLGSSPTRQSQGSSSAGQLFGPCITRTHCGGADGKNCLLFLHCAGGCISLSVEYTF